jgi:membrane protein
MKNYLEIWKNKIRSSMPVRKTVVVLKRIVLPGFEGLNLYQVLKFLLIGLQQGKITNRASAVCFRFLLAIPPLLIVFLSVIPFIPIADFQENVMLYLSKAMPQNSFGLVENTVNDLVMKKQQTLFSLSFLLALFYATNAVQAMLEGFSHSIHLDKSHGILLQYARSLGLLIVFGLTLVINVALITFSGPLLNWLQELDIIGGELVVLLLEIAKWIIIILLFEIMISILYRAGHSGRWRAFNAGATFATIGLIIVSLLFAWYVNNFGNYNKLYGSVGTVLVVMLWLYFNTIVLLIGFEINASVHGAKNIAVQDIEPEQEFKEIQ